MKTPKLMEQKPTYSPKDERSCYRVPENYFDDLTAQLVTKAQSAPVVDNSWGGALRRMMGFVAGFVIFVGLAAAALYLTPQAAIEQHEQMAQNANVDEFAVLYDVSEDDILAYYYPTDEQQQQQLQENVQLAVAIDEYLMTYPVAEVYDEEVDY